MNQIFFYLLLSVFNLVSSTVFAACVYDPMPPVPPSPAEFKEPANALVNGSTVHLSWPQVRNQEGYFVSVCSGGGFLPLMPETQRNQLVVNDLPVGEHVFLIKAYVKVAGSYVFNPGVLAKALITSTNSAESSSGASSPAPSTAPVSDAPKISASEVSRVAQLFPKLEASRSFYSAEHPDVINPMFETTLPDGRKIPALLQDAEIDKTLTRVMMAQASSPVVAQSPQSQPVSAQASSTIQPVEASVPQAQIASIADLSASSRQASLVSSSTGSGSTPASTSLSASSMGADSAAPVSDKTSVIILALIVILGLLYFVFAKEAK